ncbi:ribose-phosphate pyrophosphokinase [bacterium]|nr:ribose-phosphate pyrophosphokinase [bacterium]
MRNSPPALLFFSGNSNMNLALKVSKYLGVPIAGMTFERFQDGEIHLKSEVSVRGQEIYIMQSTNPPSDNLFELLIMIDALKRASAEKITVIIPYFGYARQDRKTQGREPITARLIANLIETAGANRVISIDLHAGQIQGFFDIPSDNLTAVLLFAQAFKQIPAEDLVIVSPDVGGVNRAKNLSNLLPGSHLAICSKSRMSKDKVDDIKLIGEVKDKIAIIIDDIISTASTLQLASHEIKNQGSKEIYACATHGMLVGSAIDKLNHSAIDKVLVTDSIQIDPLKLAACPKIKIVTVAPLIGEVINRIHNNASVSEVFEEADVNGVSLFVFDNEVNN